MLKVDYICVLLSLIYHLIYHDISSNVVAASCCSNLLQLYQVGNSHNRTYISSIYHRHISSIFDRLSNDCKYSMCVYKPSYMCIQTIIYVYNCGCYQLDIAATSCCNKLLQREAATRGSNKRLQQEAATRGCNKCVYTNDHICVQLCLLPQSYTYMIVCIHTYNICSFVYIYIYIIYIIFSNSSYAVGFCHSRTHI